MTKLQLGLAPTIGACHDYYPNEAKQPTLTRSISITPVVVRKDGEETHVLRWLCNLGATCYSKECVYARGRGYRMDIADESRSSI